MLQGSYTERELALKTSSTKAGGLQPFLRSSSSLHCLVVHDGNTCILKLTRRHWTSISCNMLKSATVYLLGRGIYVWIAPQVYNQEQLSDAIISVSLRNRLLIPLTNSTTGVNAASLCDQTLLMLNIFLQRHIFRARQAP